VWWYQEGNMTAYYLLLRPWLHLGQSEAWIRLLSVIFGVAAIPAMFFLARRLADSTTALVAAALLAFSPTHIYYSQEARSYSLTIFLVLLSAFYFVRAMQESRNRDWALWALFSTVAVYAHYFAALVLVAEAVSVLLLKPAKVQWRRLIGWTALTTVVALPGISFVILRGGSLNLPWIPQPTPKEILHLAMFLGGSGAKFALYLVLWATGTFTLVRIWRTQERSEQSWRGGIILQWAVLPVLITIAVSLHHSVFALKYLLICLPGTILLAALGAQSLRAKYIGMALVIVLCGLSVGTDIRAAYKPREDWRSATRAILSGAQPGDAIVFYPFYSRVAFDYYRGRYGAEAPTLKVFAPPFYGSGNDERTLQQALASPASDIRHVWVVMQEGGAQPGDLATRAPATAAALTSRFGAAKSEQQFKDLAVVEFGD
jgi:4-amino-4-deoxy-L-arabinose transferase-like glycosyltransferase